jgi:hypothetical protein
MGSIHKLELNNTCKLDGDIDINTYIYDDGLFKEYVCHYLIG